MTPDLFKGTEFGDVLQQAFKIKGAQSTFKRRSFEKHPAFVQHTLFFGEKEDWARERDLAFAERLTAAGKYKAAGNKLFEHGDMVGAVDL